MFDKLLVAIDLKEKSKLGIKHSIDLSKKYGSFVNIIHVNQDFIDDSDQIMLRVDNSEINDALEEYKSNCHNQIDRYIKSYNKNFSNYKIFLKTGQPDEEIINLAEELSISLIIMGTNGKDSVKDYLLGSTATTIIQKSKFPVLVLHNK